jgi:hypothetical protein
LILEGIRQDVERPPAFVEGWGITCGSAAVRVAVLGSGIAPGPVEFQGRILSGFDFVKEDADPENDRSHGRT